MVRYSIFGRFTPVLYDPPEWITLQLYHIGNTLKNRSIRQRRSFYCRLLPFLSLSNDLHKDLPGTGAVIVVNYHYLLPGP